MIVSCGEALIDFLPRATADGAPAFAPFPGGSPFNVAVALGRLGAPTGFFGGLSDDIFGETLRLALYDSGVDATLANLSSRPTTLAFVTFAEGSARYAFFDEGSAGRMLTEADLPALPQTVTALHCGSFCLAEEPCGSAFEAFMRHEQNERLISLDINVRPTLIRNRDGYLARIERMVAMADIVKLSEEDLTWLTPDGTFNATAHRWLAAGARLVVLTKGAAGAEALSARASAKVEAPMVTVADTVGAGDTFTAGLLARLDKRELLGKQAVGELGEAQLVDALTFAAKAAAITVSRPGADPPWLREIC